MEGIELVERDQELAAMRAAVKSCLGNNGEILVLEGVAGHGKTALLAAFRDIVKENGFQVLRARSNEFESEFPFGVVRQLFGDWLATAGPAERSRVLRGPAKLIAPLLDYGPQGARAGGDDEQYAILIGLYWTCVHIAERTPVALLLDDIWWADEASLRFLHYLTARIEDLPVLLAVTTDPTEWGHQARNLSAIVASPAARTIRLAPFSEAGTRAHVGARLGEDPDPGLVDACHRATGGIPFLLNELLGEIALARRHSGEVPPRRVFDLVPPKVVRGVLRRLSFLAPAAVALVEAMAVLGDEAEVKHAVEIAGIDQRAAAEALGALADVGLMRPGVPPRHLHPTVRAAIYQSLSVSARNAAHARAARVLDQDAAPLEDVARHLLRADAAGNRTVVSLLRAAARKAGAGNRVTDAVTFLTRALQEPPTPEDTVPVLVELGRAELRAQLPRALDHLGQAVELCDEPLTRARVGLDLGAGLVACGRNDEAIALFEELREEIGGRDQQLATLLDVAAVAAGQQMPHLRGGAAQRLRRLVEADARSPSLARLLAANRATRALRQGASAQRVGELAEEALKEALPDGLNLQLHDVSVYLWFELATVMACCDRLEEADGLLSRALENAKRNGKLLVTGAYHALRAWVRCQSGRLAEAEADARLTLEHCDTLDFRSPAAVLALTSRAEVLTARQEFGAAKALLEEYEFTGAMRRSFAYVPVLFARGRLHAAMGAYDAGIEHFAQGCRLLEDSDMHNPALLYAAEAVVMRARAGQREAAAGRAEALLPRVRAFGAPRGIAAALRARGLAAQDATAVGRLEQAAELLAGTDARLDHAAVLVDLGRALRRHDRPGPARRRLTSALEAAQDCGAWGLAKAARAELSAMGVRVRFTEEGTGSLTARERRVAELAAEGRRNRDIACALFVTVKTVEWHLNRVYRKLGIASREELRQALTEGRLPPPGSGAQPSRAREEPARRTAPRPGALRGVPRHRALYG